MRLQAAVRVDWYCDSSTTYTTLNFLRPFSSGTTLSPPQAITSRKALYWRHHSHRQTRYALVLSGGTTEHQHPPEHVHGRRSNLITYQRHVSRMMVLGTMSRPLIKILLHTHPPNQPKRHDHDAASTHRRDSALDAVNMPPANGPPCAPPTCCGLGAVFFFSIRLDMLRAVRRSNSC
jgi:hypothetical protein